MELCNEFIKLGREAKELGDEYRGDWSDVDGRVLQLEFRAYGQSLEAAGKEIEDLKKKIELKDKEIKKLKKGVKV